MSLATSSPAPRAKTLEHSTHDYARAVADGRVRAGRWVRLACERHLADLANGHERGLWFDPAAADVAFRFFGLLKLSKGKWASPRFELQPWQRFFLGSIYGWRRADGFRRFRTAHLEVGRKNGKTETAGGVALKGTCADGEEGAEVYCLATKKDQARITFDVAKALARSDALKKHLRPLKAVVKHEASGSKLEPLGADEDSLDGLNVHSAVCDELHAWKYRELWDVIDTATGARAQPLILATTTAGWNRRSIWWERRELATRLLDGAEGFDNDEFFPLIYCPDEGDDLDDPAVWAKGNPSLGVIVRQDELAKRHKEAKQSPKGWNAFVRLRLDLPTEQAVRWMPMGRWKRCRDPVNEDDLAGRPCFGGLDLSQTTDLCAWALVFPPSIGDPKWRLIVRHFLPKEDLGDRERRDKVPYGQWADGNRLTLTDGAWVDYGHIRKRVKDDAAKFRLVAMAYDRRFAPSLVQTLILEDGVECVPWSQGVPGMNTATKEIYRMALAGEVAHQGCPLLDWEVENTAIKGDAYGNQMPDKEASAQRIDGVVAGIMALGLAIHKYGEGPPDAGAIEIDLGDFGGW